MDEYRYHWQLDGSAWYLRFYLWLWRGDPKRTDFCKLFWGYLLLLPGLLIHGLISLGEFAARIGEGRREERVQELIERKEQEPPPAVNIMQNLLHDFASIVASLIMMSTPFWRLLWKLIVGAFQIIGALTVIAIVGGAVAATVLEWDIARWIWLGIIALGLLYVLLSVTSDAGEVIDRTGDRLIGFFDVMKLGYKSVKSNTCPKVEIIEKVR